MLTTATLEKTLSLLDTGYTFASITEETGITTEDAEAVHLAWFNGTSEQVSRELQLAGVLEAASTRLRTGQGWQQGTTGDVLHEILQVYPAHVKKALAMACWRGNSEPSRPSPFGMRHCFPSVLDSCHGTRRTRHSSGSAFRMQQSEFSACARTHRVSLFQPVGLADHSSFGVASAMCPDPNHAHRSARYRPVPE
jgi:hypothetical protein